MELHFDTRLLEQPVSFLDLKNVPFEIDIENDYGDKIEHPAVHKRVVAQDVPFSARKH
jgi:hypothetical protein